MKKLPLIGFPLLLLLSLVVWQQERLAAAQVGPRKYIIKPLNLGINTEVRARSTRNLQVRVTDENDRPVTDAPVVFSLNGAGGSTNVGSLAGQTSSRVMTNAQGVAQVDYTAAETVGDKVQLKAQVEGSDVAWEATLLIISALLGDSSPKKATPVISKPIIGTLPKSSVARHTFTTTDGEKFSLDSRRGKVIVVFFFGTWCDASKRQFLYFKDNRERDKAEDVQVVGMSVKDPRSTPEIFQQFMTNQQPNYPVVKDVADKHFVDFVNSKDVSVPQTLIYGRDGRLSGHFFGFNPQVGAEIAKHIGEALAKK